MLEDLIIHMYKKRYRRIKEYGKPNYVSMYRYVNRNKRIKMYKNMRVREQSSYKSYSCISMYVVVYRYVYKEVDERKRVTVLIFMKNV